MSIALSAPSIGVRDEDDDLSRQMSSEPEDGLSKAPSSNEGQETSPISSPNHGLELEDPASLEGLATNDSVYSGKRGIGLRPNHRRGSLPRTAGAKKRYFGIPRERTRRRVHTQHTVNPFDYEQKYPEDPYGKEFDKDARIWKVYTDEAELYDVELTEAWKDTVDVLLVFAGLFSAIVATLIGVSIQALQPDYAQVTVAIFLELVAIQRALASGSDAADIPPSSFNLDALPSPSALDRRVNGLWFTSLAFSLCSALTATIIKQWIQQYRAFTYGSTMDQVLHRQFRYMGLNKWRVPLIIALLPSMLHVSLFLFLAGMSLFLFPLDQAAFYVVTAITCGTCAMYLISNFLPAFFHGCAYKTPISTLTSQAIAHCICSVLRLFSVIFNLLPSSKHFPQWDYLATSWKSRSRDPISWVHPEALQADAVKWLDTTSSNGTVHAIIIQSFAGMPPTFDLAERKRLLQGNRSRDIAFICRSQLRELHGGRHASDSEDYHLAKIERLLRSYAQCKLCASSSHDYFTQDASFGPDFDDLAQNILDISQHDEQLHPNLQLAASLVRVPPRNGTLDTTTILLAVVNPTIHPMLAMWALCSGLHSSVEGSLLRGDGPNEDISWTAFIETPAKISFKNPGYLKWSLLVRFLAVIHLPHSPTHDKDSVFLISKVKEEFATKTIIMDDHRHELLTKALSCYLATLWISSMDDRFWEILPSSGRTTFMAIIVALGVEMQCHESSQAAYLATEELRALVDIIVRATRLLCAEFASTPPNSYRSQCLVEIFISSFCRPADSFTSNDAHMCLHLLAPISTEWYKSAWLPGMLQLWTPFLQESLDILSNHTAVTEEPHEQLTQMRRNPSQTPTISSPANLIYDSATLPTLLRISRMQEFGKFGSIPLYFAQLCRLAKSTKHTLASWRTAIGEVIDVSDGPDHLLVAPADTIRDYDNCMHQLLEELKQLQGAGGEDRLDFELYKRVRQVSQEDEDGDGHSPKNGGTRDKQRSATIDDEVWIVQPFSTQVDIKNPEDSGKPSSATWKYRARSWMNKGLRGRAVADPGDAAV